MAAEIAGRQGSSAWEGFKTHPDLRQAFDREAGAGLIAVGLQPTDMIRVPAAAQEMTDAGGDTAHEVTVRFVDAPAGLRSGITKADGPARLALRTNYAMAAPF